MTSKFAHEVHNLFQGLTLHTNAVTLTVFGVFHHYHQLIHTHTWNSLVLERPCLSLHPTSMMTSNNHVVPLQKQLIVNQEPMETLKSKLSIVERYLDIKITTPTLPILEDIYGFTLGDESDIEPLLVTTSTETGLNMPSSSPPPSLLILLLPLCCCSADKLSASMEVSFWMSCSLTGLSRPSSPGELFTSGIGRPRTLRAWGFFWLALHLVNPSAGEGWSVLCLSQPRQDKDGQYVSHPQTRRRMSIVFQNLSQDQEEDVSMCFKSLTPMRKISGGCEYMCFKSLRPMRRMSGGYVFIWALQMQLQMWKTAGIEEQQAQFRFKHMHALDWKNLKWVVDKNIQNVIILLGFMKNACSLSLSLSKVEMGSGYKRYKNYSVRVYETYLLSLYLSLSAWEVCIYSNGFTCCCENVFCKREKEKMGRESRHSSSYNYCHHGR